LYAIIEELSPGAFSGLEESSKSLRVANLAYFSFNVVTTVALTDVVPASRTAQMMVLLQEFASVFYMAFVIARLVGMYSGSTTISTYGDDEGAKPKRDS
ncbi:MAG TPA: ion channel, partial [Burkholderiales bacterium]|nr:ion channel [Burkholderiales bacterium]